MSFILDETTSKASIHQSADELREAIRKQRQEDDTGVFSMIMDSLMYEELVDHIETTLIQNLELQRLVGLVTENTKDENQLEQNVLAENIRLSEALSFYAEEKNYLEDKARWSMIIYDNGEKAREALKRK